MIKLRSGLLILLCFFSIACIQFRSQAPSPYAGMDVEYILCKDVVDTGDAFLPIEVSSQFRLSDRQICCLVRIKDMFEAAKVHWRWYTPSGGLYRKSPEIIVNEGNDYLESLTAVDKIIPSRETMTSGLWTVAVFWNGGYRGGRSFYLMTEGMNR